MVEPAREGDDIGGLDEFHLGGPRTAGELVRLDGLEHRHVLHRDLTLWGGGAEMVRW